MKKLVETKRQKVLRYILMITYLLQLFLSSTPFLWGNVNGEMQDLSVLEIVVQPSFTYTSDQAKLALFYCLFLLIPLIGAVFMIFDKKSNLKNGISFLLSAIGVMLITFGVGNAIASGSLCAIMLYLVSALLSVYSMLIYYKEKEKLKK